MSAVLTPPAPRPGPFRFTRDQYYRLGELGFFDGKRVERLRGEIVEMIPIGWPHVVGRRKTTRALEQVFAGVGWVGGQDPVTLADSDPEPDVMVIAGRFEDYADHPTTALLVVEVADTAPDRDTTVKAELYAEAGIPEYWVLDLDGRQLLVFRDPRPLPAILGGTAYRIRQAFGPGDPIASLAAPNAPVAVADLLP